VESKLPAASNACRYGLLVGGVRKLSTGPTGRTSTLSDRLGVEKRASTAPETESKKGKLVPPLVIVTTSETKRKSQAGFRKDVAANRIGKCDPRIMGVYHRAVRHVIEVDGGLDSLRDPMHADQ
jgi:hypothetical protein